MIRSIFRFFVIWHVMVKFGIELIIPPTRLHFLVTIWTYLMPVAWAREISDFRASRFAIAISLAWRL